MRLHCEARAAEAASHGFTVTLRLDVRRWHVTIVKQRDLSRYRGNACRGAAVREPVKGIAERIRRTETRGSTRCTIAQISLSRRVC